MINVDDADTSLFSERMLQEYFPNIESLARSGVRFSNLHVTTPFCGPSRASLMTGQYAYTIGVKLNDPNSIYSRGMPGGYGAFKQGGHHQAELGVWMKAAGYRTMHVGKYHHHDFDNQVPPGWDDFRSSLGARYFGGYRFSNKDKPSGKGYATPADEYVTYRDGAEARETIRTHAKARPDQPFFLYLAPIAPHVGYPNRLAIAHPDFDDLAADEKVERGEDFNEVDMTDKPSHLQFPRLTAPSIEKLDHEHRVRIRAIKGVDVMLGRLIRELKAVNRFENTVIIFTSDNGYELGHHRIRNKKDPYERSTRVPLIIAGKGISHHGVHSNALLAHIDICPTILEMAGATIPNEVQGASFSGLLEEPTQNQQTGLKRDCIMIENWSDIPTFGKNVLGAYTALRGQDWKYVSWANGEKEYYDLANDPHQLNNKYNNLSVVEKKRFNEKLTAFRGDKISTLPGLSINPASVPTTVLDGNLSVNGLTEDNHRTHAVRLALYSETSEPSGLYYDGKNWTKERTWLNTKLLAKGEPISQWQFADKIKHLPSKASLARITLIVQAIDVDGNLSEPKTLDQSFDWEQVRSTAANE